ncbi:MAG: BamA/TamA family outer membrane protein [Flavisolibacter sp.]
MKKKLTILLFILPVFTIAQKTVVIDSTDPNFRTVIPGAEYKAGNFYRFLWGTHYRKEWTTPVKVAVINLDTTAGGLTAVEQGGGRQSKTLRLKNRNGKQFVLRTVDKDYAGALPEITHGTFIERLAKDQVSTAHPFAAITVPIMIDAVGVYHTNPRIVFVPYTPSLGEYNESFANTLCLFEERPDDDQSDASNFGFSEDVKGTEKMYNKIFSESDHRVDQRAFVKARLFDMFLGDWGRHDDQWRWAEFDSADYKIYKPIPRDRDQAYTQFDGFLLSRILGREDLEHLRSFSYKIKNIKKYNFPARYIDRQLTNEVRKEEWISIAKELQHALTDSIIERSIQQLPPELYSVSGDVIVAKLKSRREHLVEYAEKYYRFINKQVEVVGTEKNELFSIKRLNDHETEISLYDLDKEGSPKQHPFYSRTFLTKETKEVRLYGLDGNDVYRIEGAKNSTRIRIIGGTDKDSLINSSSSSSKLKYYDNEGNVIVGDISKKLSNDTAINAYNYKAFKENSGHSIKSPYYANVRGIYLQAGYTYTKQKWRKEPFAWTQTARLIYSTTNNSFGGEYQGVFNEVIGKWNVLVNGRFDEKLQHYFFGAGNETTVAEEKPYYGLSTSELVTSVGLNRNIGFHSAFGISGLYQWIQAKNEPGKYAGQNLPLNDPTAFDRKNFIGVELNFVYFNVNHPVVPEKGIGFVVNAAHMENLTQKDRTFNRYSGLFGFYLPLFSHFSLGVRTGGIALTGKPEFHQLAALGGGDNLRGYFRERFYGMTSFYDNNELRWMPNIKSHLFNGKIGIIAFFDEARVWQSGEVSKKWHSSVGGGLMIAPFNIISLSAYYGISEEGNRIHLRLKRMF